MSLQICASCREPYTECQYIDWHLGRLACLLHSGPTVRNRQSPGILHHHRGDRFHTHVCSNQKHRIVNVDSATRFRQSVTSSCVTRGEASVSISPQRRPRLGGFISTEDHARDVPTLAHMLFARKLHEAAVALNLHDARACANSNVYRANLSLVCLPLLLREGCSSAFCSDMAVTLPASRDVTPRHEACIAVRFWSIPDYHEQVVSKLYGSGRTKRKLRYNLQGESCGKAGIVYPENTRTISSNYSTRIPFAAHAHRRSVLRSTRRQRDAELVRHTNSLSDSSCFAPSDFARQRTFCSFWKFGRRTAESWNNSISKHSARSTLPSR